MEFLMETTSEIKFNDTVIDKCYNNIKKAYQTMQKSAFTISANIAKIASEPKRLEALGYKDIVDFGQQVLNLEKSQTYAFVSIGKRFTKNGVCKIGDNFSLSQLQALLPIKNDKKLDELLAAKKITADMSVRQIKAVVKNILGKNTVDSTAKEISERSEKIEDTENVEEIENVEDMENVEDEEAEEKYELNITCYIGEDDKAHYLCSAYGSVDYVEISKTAIMKMIEEFEGGVLK